GALRVFHECGCPGRRRHAADRPAVPVQHTPDDGRVEPVVPRWQAVRTRYEQERRVEPWRLSRPPTHALQPLPYAPQLIDGGGRLARPRRRRYRRLVRAEYHIGREKRGE